MRFSSYENLWPDAMAVIESAKKLRERTNGEAARVRRERNFDVVLQNLQQKITEAKNEKV